MSHVAERGVGDGVTEIVGRALLGAVTRQTEELAQLSHVRRRDVKNVCATRHTRAHTTRHTRAHTTLA